MMTEAKLIEQLDKARLDLPELLKSVQLKIDNNDFDGAIENLAIVNANLVGIIILTELLNA
ncbi:MAG TPA: hypothetical protein VN922_17070 [Bacteroidia bacterium]|nr:hypothetical protein [Bacteroidia bacterium]